MNTLLKTMTAVETDVITLRPRVTELERDELDQVLENQRLIAGRNITRNIVRQSNDAIYISTRDNRFVDVNQPLLNLLGYSLDDLIGEDIGIICVVPQDAYEIQREAEQKGYLIDYRITLRAKDGSEVMCLITSTVRWYNDDNIPDNQPLFKVWVRKAGF